MHFKARQEKNKQIFLSVIVIICISLITGDLVSTSFHVLAGHLHVFFAKNVYSCLLPMFKTRLLSHAEWHEMFIYFGC